MPVRPTPTISRVAFTALLAAAMAMATFAGPAFAVLARFIIDDLGLTRAELGWVVAAFSAVGALASPSIGRVTDVLGGRRTLAAVFLLSGLGLVSISVAPGYWWLFAAAVLTGLGQASANPGTNKLISVHIPVGRRGAVTGLKQSGVQIGVFLAGLLLPTGALAWGWRTTLAIVGAVSILTLVAVRLVVPPDVQPTKTPGRTTTTVWTPPIIWLTSYGFLMGAAGGAVNTYIPLYGEEAIGLTVTAAGLVAGVAGLIAFFARIWWARHSEQSGDYVLALTWIAGLSVAFVGALLAAETGGEWLLWVGALGLGASATAWNAVGMLAVMVFAGREQSGGASGVVLLGFLAGLGLGPPAFGWSVDELDSYAPGLIAALFTFLLATLLATRWRRKQVPA